MKRKSLLFHASLISVCVLSAAGSVTAQLAFTRNVEAETVVQRRAETMAGSGGSRPLFQPSLLTGEPQLIIESGPVSFGEVIAGEKQELTDAVIVRVISDSEWVLHLVQDSATVAGSHATIAPMEMLEWKSAQSLRWSEVRAGIPVAVSRGRRTGPGGEVVPVDLRLRVGDRDALGNYGFNLRLSLETNR